MAVFGVARDSSHMIQSFVVATKTVSIVGIVFLDPILPLAEMNKVLTPLDTSARRIALKRRRNNA